MDIMKRSLLLGLSLFLLSLPGFAAVTPSESIDAEYLTNGGFSESFAEDVLIQRNRALGRPVEPLYNKSQNFIVKGWNKLRGYIDPGLEEADKLHHDIKLSPAFTDL